MSSPGAAGQEPAQSGPAHTARNQAPAGVGNAQTVAPTSQAIASPRLHSPAPPPSPHPDKEQEKGEAKVYCHACRALNPKSLGFCRFCSTNLNSEYDIPVRLFESSDRLSTLNNLTHLAPATRIVEIFLRKLGTPWVEAQFLGDSVRIGEKQFPDFYHAAQECAKKLALPRMPRIYFTYSSPIVASAHPTYSMGTNDDPIIILSTNFMSKCSTEEFKFVISRELGHIKCGHPVYLTAGVIAKDVAAAGLGFGLAGVDHLLGGVFTSVVINQPLMAALNAWFRAANYTADKAALVTLGDIELVKRIFTKTLVGWYGAGGMQEKVNVEEFLGQYDDLEDSVGRLSEILGPLGSFPGGLTVPGEFNPGYTMPFAVRRLRELIEYHRTQRYGQARKIVENMEKGIYELPEEATSPVQQFCGYCGTAIPRGSAPALHAVGCPSDLKILTRREALIFRRFAGQGT